MTVGMWDAKTHVGAVRLKNEDCFVVDPGRGLFVVCDGMGGHARGEVAATTACATIRDWVAAWPPSPRERVARELLVGAIHAANRNVFRLGTGQHRPGTTVAAILRARERFIVAHVGDSRVYLLRRGGLVQLTRDHSLTNEFIDQGRLKPEQAATFPLRHIITRAVGLKEDVAVDVQVLPTAPGDVFLLASDGLEVVDPATIQACLRLPPAAAVEKLIAHSLAMGAPDNVTVVVTRLGTGGQPLDRRLR